MRATVITLNWLLCLGSISGCARIDVIDFENGFQDLDPVTVVQTDSNRVEFSVGLHSPSGPAYVAVIGEPVTGFVPQDGIGTPAELVAGKFFLTDQRTPLDTPPLTRFDFFVKFESPVSYISLNLYDFRTDGGAVVGDVVHLTAFADRGMTQAIGQRSFTIPSHNLPDGNVITLRVKPTITPLRPIQAASITFKSSSGSAFDGHDSGLGIDNIEFQTVGR